MIAAINFAKAVKSSYYAWAVVHKCAYMSRVHFLLGTQIGGGLVADATTQVSMYNEVHEGDEDVGDHDPPLDHDEADYSPVDDLEQYVL